MAKVAEKSHAEAQSSAEVAYLVLVVVVQPAAAAVAAFCAPFGSS